MTKEAERVVQHARPPLRIASPLVSSLIWVFATGNLFLGYGLFSIKVKLVNFLIINDVLTTQLWGGIFFALGLAMFYTHFRNDWKAMRNLMLMGVLVKSFWLFGLLARLFAGDPDNITVLTIWAMITATQILTYIYFLPVPKDRFTSDVK